MLVEYIVVARGVYEQAPHDDLVGRDLHDHWKTLWFQCFNSLTLREVECAFDGLIAGIADEDVTETLPWKHFPSSEALRETDVVVCFFLRLGVSHHCAAFDESWQELLVLSDFLELHFFGSIGSHRKVILVEELPFDLATHHVRPRLQHELLV